MKKVFFFFVTMHYIRFLQHMLFVVPYVPHVLQFQIGITYRLQLYCSPPQILSLSGFTQNLSRLLNY
jgi:hypothetical protein